MDRRNFIGSLATGGAGFALSTNLLLSHAKNAKAADGIHADNNNDNNKGSEFDLLTKRLLVTWCEGMLRRQINDSANPQRHGALGCPACAHIHGRCSDALYPFLHMAHVTGDKKYIDAAIGVYEWAENNVSQPDGSWRVSTKPKSWRGTSIFGAIALAEALHFHGEVLDEKRRNEWTARLDKAAGGYLYRDFKKIDFTNLNYGMTGVYGFHLFGQLLNNQKYTDRSQQFAKRVKEFFTEPNALLWGEGKPNNNRSGRGLLPVDLGYNVEESLNGPILYALEVGDTELLDLMVKSMNGHLEFMLPDGAWDNSWGTRSAKWSYWGSRTSDGCQAGFGLMADHNPAFATAALKNAQLLQRCTADGLLHGGPHYVSHGVDPCIHHTFAHAKVMAFVQDKMHEMPKVDGSAPLPRAVATGVKHFPELDVWTVAKGPWRSTVSAYDSIYKTKNADHIQQPTGGALAVLYHDKVGTLLAGSMARYILVEPFNMQPQPDEDFCLTPRIETHSNGGWQTNLYDLKAEVGFDDDGQRIRFDVKTTLQDEDRNVVSGEVPKFDMNYEFVDEKITISVRSSDAEAGSGPVSLVVPILSPTGEAVRQVSETRIEIDKPEGTVVVQCNIPLSIKKTEKGRVFNMVPGAEAVPVIARQTKQTDQKIEFTISIV
jgi:hypothetical protein